MTKATEGSMHCESWCALSDEELAARDIAEVNLAAAVGLPRAGRLDVPALLGKIDEWASYVQQGTKRALKNYDREEYKGMSERRFKMMALVTVIQRNLGVRYHLPFSEGEYDAGDSRNHFLHGILTGHGGTCVTMPVLYAAVGRRLGYPLKLVCAKEHLFCRWDDPDGTHFNIEATSSGFVSHPDDYYLHCPRPLTQDDLAQGRYLYSLSPRQELAHFLGERGNCLLDNLQIGPALKAFHYAAEMDPVNKAYRHAQGIATIMLRMLDTLRGQPQADQNVLKISIPTPKEPWETFFFPAPHEYIGRILRNRQRRTAAARNQSEPALSTGV